MRPAYVNSDMCEETLAQPVPNPRQVCAKKADYLAGLQVYKVGDLVQHIQNVRQAHNQGMLQMEVPTCCSSVTEEEGAGRSHQPLH